MSNSNAVCGKIAKKASGDNESRRTFLKKAGTVAITIAGSDLIFPEDPKSEYRQIDKGVIPWYRHITRWGQTNITEADPATYDIKWWRSYWKRT